MKFCCVMHSVNEEAIDCILAASAFFSEVIVILIQDAIALQHQKAFKVLSEYDINAVYCISPQNLAEIKALLQQQDRIIHF